MSDYKFYPAAGPFSLPRFGMAMAGRCGPIVAAFLRSALADAFEPRGRRGNKTLPEELPPRSGLYLEADGRGSPTQRLRRILRAARLVFGLALKGLFYAHIVFILSTSLLILIFAKTDPGATVLMLYRKYENGYAISRPRPVKISQVGKRRRDILLRVEDWTFYRHHGFELAAIKNAARINRQIGRPMYGGSTISMQTARTLFLVPFKSYFRKYLEAIVTLELEFFLSKDRILELYFSYAEWGKGVFGIQAAAIYHYGVPHTKLSDEQFIRLVSVLSSPLRYGPKTLHNSRLLAWRYEYLMARFLPPPPVEAAKPLETESLPSEESGSKLETPPKAEEAIESKGMIPAPNG